MKNTRKRKRSTGPVRLSKARLDELVEEAIVDCYNESEQVTGLYTMIEDSLAVPFETTVLGVSVTVVRVQLTLRDEIVAVCRRAGTRQTVPLLDLPLPSPPPAGSRPPEGVQPPGPQDGAQPGYGYGQDTGHPDGQPSGQQGWQAGPQGWQAGQPGDAGRFEMPADRPRQRWARSVGAPASTVEKEHACLVSLRGGL